MKGGQNSKGGLEPEPTCQSRAPKVGRPTQGMPHLQGCRAFVGATIPAAALAAPRQKYRLNVTRGRGESRANKISPRVGVLRIFPLPIPFLQTTTDPWNLIARSTREESRSSPQDGDDDEIALPTTPAARPTICAGEPLLPPYLGTEPTKARRKEQAPRLRGARKGVAEEAHQVRSVPWGLRARVVEDRGSDLVRISCLFSMDYQFSDLVAEKWTTTKTRFTSCLDGHGLQGCIVPPC